jgi:hypothetical protein
MICMRRGVRPLHVVTLIDSGTLPATRDVPGTTLTEQLAAGKRLAGLSQPHMPDGARGRRSGAASVSAAPCEGEGVEEAAPLMHRSLQQLPWPITGWRADDHERAVEATSVQEPCSHYVISRGDHDERPPFVALGQTGDLPCLAARGEWPRSEARRPSFRAPGAQLHPPLCTIGLRNHDRARDVTANERRGRAEALTVRPRTENNECVGRTYAVVVGPHEEVRAGREPERNDGAGAERDCPASCHDGSGKSAIRDTRASVCSTIAPIAAGGRQSRSTTASPIRATPNTTLAPFQWASHHFSGRRRTLVSNGVTRTG